MNIYIAILRLKAKSTLKMKKKPHQPTSLAELQMIFDRLQIRVLDKYLV